MDSIAYFIVPRSFSFLEIYPWLSILVRIASPLIDLRIFEPHKFSAVFLRVLELWFDCIVNCLSSAVIDMHLHPPMSFTAESFSLCLSWLRSPSPPMIAILIGKLFSIF